MNKIKMIAAMFIAGILLTFVSCGDNGKSKKISIAYANWSEGIAMTNLAKAIFEDQGYDVKLLNADLAPIFTSISRKKADVFMDVWMPVTMENSKLSGIFMMVPVSGWWFRITLRSTQSKN